MVIPDPLIPNLEQVLKKSILNSDCDIGSIIVKGHHFAVNVTHFKSHKISAKFWELREIWEIREFDFPKVEIFCLDQQGYPSCGEKTFD